MEQSAQPTPFVDLGERLFRYRDYTAVPFLVVALFAAEPSVATATIGLLFILIGEAMRIYGVSFLGPVARTRSDSTGPYLVTQGPFAVVRNPVYLGNLTICLGFSIYAGVIWLLMLTMAAAVVQYVSISAFEEKLLAEKFGEEYLRYRETVPGWIPGRLPKWEEMDLPPSFREALHAERRTLTAIVLTLGALMLTARK